MGAHVLADEEVVPGEEYFGHDVAFVSVVFEVVFYSEIVEAVDFWFF